jgi:hypothetical protein
MRHHHISFNNPCRVLNHQSSNAITTISHIDNKTASMTATAITTKDHSQTNTGLATAATTTTARPCHRH